MDGQMDGWTGWIDGQMDRWMVQAINMCFNALKEVRKCVLSEDAFLEIEKVVRGHPRFWVFSPVYNLQSFDIFPQRTFESSQRRSRRWEATQQDCVWRLSACGEAGLKGEPQIAAGGVLIWSSALTAQGLLCKHSSMRFAQWALESLPEVSSLSTTHPPCLLL